MSLADLHARLYQIYDSIRSFDVPLPQPPVIDTSSSHERRTRQVLPGLRFLREEVKRDWEVLDKFLREDANSSTLSTNVPYLVGVWDELVHARQPVAVYRVFPLTGRQNDARNTPKKNASKSQMKTVKVDVVAENGARWVRVNTIKNSRLMMEFCEIDSYLTSDEDEDKPRLQLAQAEFDNSVLRMGRDLLAAAKTNPVLVPSPFSNLFSAGPATQIRDDTIVPQITLRLTRLNPFEDDALDPRIGKTVQCLRDMGIDVQLGVRSHSHSTPILAAPTKSKLLEPTTNINLDLSALIALISDISHSPLPRTEEEARARFIPPQNYLDWKKERVRLLTRQSQTTDAFSYDVEDGSGDDEDTWEISGQHSRALAAQAVQEMNRGTLEETHERLSAVVGESSVCSSRVAFWTTSEARHRCLQIVSKIGGKKERRRADALLGPIQWSQISPITAPVRITSNSVLKTTGVSEMRLEMRDIEEKTAAGAYWEDSRYPVKFLPLTPVHVYPSILPPQSEDQRLRTSFFDVLTRTCFEILSHEATPASPVSAPQEYWPTAEEEVPPAVQTSLQKLTEHTVRSMLAGASRRYTTLTTNRSSVKAVLKEMQKVCGNCGYEPGEGDIEKAALWILDPRSLSEGMRSE